MNNETGILGLQNDLKEIVNISHIIHALLSNTLNFLSEQQLRSLLWTREAIINISDSMVLDFLDNILEDQLYDLNSHLEAIGLTKGMDFQVYKFCPDTDNPNIYVWTMSIDLIDGDDYIDFEEEDEVANRSKALDKETIAIPLAMSATNGSK